MSDFNRPLPSRLNDKLRNNLLAPNVEKQSAVDQVLISLIKV